MFWTIGKIKWSLWIRWLYCIDVSFLILKAALGLYGRLPLCFSKYTLKYLGAMGVTFATLHWLGKHKKCLFTQRIMKQMWIIGESEWKVYDSPLYYSCNFPVSLRLFQNKNLRSKQLDTHCKILYLAVGCLLNQTGLL